MRIVLEKLRIPNNPTHVADIQLCTFGTFKRVKPNKKGIAWVQFYKGKIVASFKEEDLIVIDL